MARWGGSLALFTTGLLAIAFPAGAVDEGCG